MVRDLIVDCVRFKRLKGKNGEIGTSSLHFQTYEDLVLLNVFLNLRTTSAKINSASTIDNGLFTQREWECSVV